eukprot:jgi/Botrbrau1/10893/Bobra.0025s0068.1
MIRKTGLPSMRDAFILIPAVTSQGSGALGPPNKDPKEQDAVSEGPCAASSRHGTGAHLGGEAPGGGSTDRSRDPNLGEEIPRGASRKEMWDRNLEWGTPSAVSGNCQRDRRLRMPAVCTVFSSHSRSWFQAREGACLAIQRQGSGILADWDSPSSRSSDLEGPEGWLHPSAASRGSPRGLGIPQGCEVASGTSHGGAGTCGIGSTFSSTGPEFCGTELGLRSTASCANGLAPSAASSPRGASWGTGSMVPPAMLSIFHTRGGPSDTSRAAFSIGSMGFHTSSTAATTIMVGCVTSRTGSHTSSTGLHTSSTGLHASSTGLHTRIVGFHTSSTGLPTSSTACDSGRAASHSSTAFHTGSTASGAGRAGNGPHREPLQGRGSGVSWDWDEAEGQEQEHGAPGHTVWFSEIMSLGELQRTIEPILPNLSASQLCLALVRLRALTNTGKYAVDISKRDTDMMYKRIERRLEAAVVERGERLSQMTWPAYCTLSEKVGFVQENAPFYIELRNQFMEQYHVMRCHSLSIAMYGLAAIDNYAHSMRPTLQILADVAANLVEAREQLSLHHISVIMYAFGKFQYAAQGLEPVPSHEQLTALADHVLDMLPTAGLMNLSIFMYGLARLRNKSGFQAADDILLAASEALRKRLEVGRLRQIQLVLRTFNMMDVRVEDETLDAIGREVVTRITRGDQAGPAAVEVSSTLSALAQTHWTPPSGWLLPVVDYAIAKAHRAKVRADIAQDLLWPAVVWKEQLPDETVEKLCRDVLSGLRDDGFNLDDRSQARLLWALDELNTAYDAEGKGLGRDAAGLRQYIRSSIAAREAAQAHAGNSRRFGSSGRRFGNFKRPRQ